MTCICGNLLSGDLGKEEEKLIMAQYTQRFLLIDFSNVNVPIRTVLDLPKMQISHIISACLMPGPLLSASRITAHRTAIKPHQ